MSNESFADQIARVRMMSRPSETWDLSTNDRAALTAVLDALALKQAGLVVWDRMTPREAFDALRAAPKVAGEWVANAASAPRDTQASLRFSPADTPIVAVQHLWNESHWTVTIGSGATVGSHATRESAMAAADEELRRRGWLLVDGEVKP